MSYRPLQSSISELRCHPKVNEIFLNSTHIQRIENGVWDTAHDEQFFWNRVYF